MGLGSLKTHNASRFGKAGQPAERGAWKSLGSSLEITRHPVPPSAWHSRHTRHPPRLNRQKNPASRLQSAKHRQEIHPETGQKRARNAPRNRPKIDTLASVRSPQISRHSRFANNNRSAGTVSGTSRAHDRQKWSRAVHMTKFLLALTDGAKKSKSDSL